MRPMIDDLELPQVQEIGTYDHRMLAEHKPVGMQGSLLQNMGRRPTRLALWGIAADDKVLEFVEKLNEKFKTGEPITFIADIVADANIDRMIIDDLKWKELAGKPDRYGFLLSLKEYIEPVEPEDTSGLNLGILDDATGLMDGLVAGLDLGQFFVTGLEKFVEPLSDLLSRTQKAGGS